MKKRRLAGLLALGMLLALIPIPQSSGPAGHLPVLMYHNVAPDGEVCNTMTVTAGRLREDLQWLADNGYQTVLPRDLASGAPLPEKPVLITFDDGYLSNYELAYPIFQEFGARFVISVMVYMQSSGADDFLSWDMCREMVDSGLVEIGSHAYRLHNLDGRGGAFTPGGTNGVQRRPDESDGDFRTRVLDDIRLSYDLISENLGQAPTFFAYPYGLTDPDADGLIRELFPVTAVTRSKTADLSGGLFDLPRYTVTMDTSLKRLLNPPLIAAAARRIRALF